MQKLGPNARSGSSILPLAASAGVGCARHKEPPTLAITLPMPASSSNGEGSIALDHFPSPFFNGRTGRPSPVN